MEVKVKCADCGRHIGSFVRLGVGKKDVEIEIHGCFHKDTYDHIKELKAEVEGLKLYIACNYKGTFDNCNPECCIGCHRDGKIQALKTKAKD